MKQYWVYILRCTDGTYYVGITSNVDFRIAEHERGHDPRCYTYLRRPVRLVHVEVFSNPEEAIFYEKRIKGWSRANHESARRALKATLRQAQGDIVAGDFVTPRQAPASGWHVEAGALAGCG